MKPSSPRGWQADVPEPDASARAPREPDPQATQKISKEELDAVLKRTKSGTRRAVETPRSAPPRSSIDTPRSAPPRSSIDTPRSAPPQNPLEGSGARPLPTVPREFPVSALPEAFPGPRDDAPEVSIVRIDSVEMAAIDPASLPPPVEQPPTPPPSSTMAAAPASFVPVTPSSASPLLAAIPTPNARPARAAQMQRHVPKRRSALEWCGIVVAVAAAMVASFFAGRFTVRLH